ncbi:MAG TPA: PP2C family protein-serine/threonine phosphatase, partial [Thermosynechococcaceae cyanobacterium]
KLGLDWLVVVVVPEAEFMEQINTNLRNTVLLCLLALAIATVVGILTARRISQPILRLSEASQEIAAGNLDHPVEERSVGEIGILARSFNQMAQQLRQSFKALEAANAELEIRVEARTTELKEANQEIKLLNDRLQEDNLRMSAELNVARQLQQMILPKAAELAQIPDLDIAGFMEPAAEVGGDYYDVIQQNGHVTIGIGDVTGHGLESGVMMIMAQTAVRALVAADRQSPVKFLQSLNEAIYQNAQRMSPGKNLSLTLLDYADGQIQITGQHEEVLMVRSNGTVERIDTIDLGFPIGMIDNIDAFVAQTQIALHPGDAVVLYTDGITEAENVHRQLYGLDRLIKVIGQHRSGSASDIRRAVIEDVRSHIGTHIVYDDITLVVLKKRLERLVQQA